LQWQKFLPALIVIVLQMAEAPEVVALPKGLKHWINSFKMPTCVLVKESRADSVLIVN
jgi:hypothetical protein